jgi:hypothetical protein
MATALANQHFSTSYLFNALFSAGNSMLNSQVAPESTYLFEAQDVVRAPHNKSNPPTHEDAH